MSYTPDYIEECCRTLLPGYDPWRDAKGFYFDVDEAKRACDFFPSMLRLTTGKWYGQPYELQPWSIAIVGNLHGWRRQSDGLRRYRKCLITTARKSSKSHIAAGLTLYHAYCEGELDPSAVVAAGSAEQAAIIFNICRCMVEQEPELARRSEVMARAIRKKTRSGGSIRFVNSAGATKHGTNESLVVLDELHVITDPTIADVLETATRSREAPLTLYTTTAGDNPAGLWAETFDYADKVRTGLIADPEFLPCLWQASPEDDITDPATWRKAQPNLGVSVSEDEYRRDLKKALSTPRYLPVFKQLSLNLPTESHAAWIPLDDWKACAGVVDPEPGAVCYGGLDLSSTQDTMALTLVFPTQDGRAEVLPFVFLPEDNAAGLFRRQKRDKAPYGQWAEQGHLILTAGNVVDFDCVIDTILEAAEKYDLREIQCDPANASNVTAKLLAAGINVKTVRQGWALSEACKATGAMILSRKLVHPDSPVLNWQMANAVVHTDRRENIWLDKAKSTRRIDAAVALVEAVSAWQFGDGAEAESFNPYADGGELITLPM